MTTIRKRTAAAALAVAAIGATIVAITAATPAPAGTTISFTAHSSTQTLKFIAVTKATHSFTKATQGIQETDTNATGKTVGFSMLYVNVTSSSSAAVNATVDTTGGFLYGTFTLNLKTGAVTNGKVTGGTGAFAGATGTIAAKAISSTKEAVTITYSG